MLKRERTSRLWLAEALPDTKEVIRRTVAAAKNPVILTACHIQKDGIDVHVMTTKEASSKCR